MNSKEFLESFKSIDNLIDCKLAELTYLIDLKKKTSIITSPALVANINLKIDNLDKEINKEIDVLIIRRNSIVDLIYKLPSDIFKAVLIDKYINRLTVYQLEDKYNYSRRTIDRILANAIIYLDNL